MAMKLSNGWRRPKRSSITLYIGSSACGSMSPELPLTNSSFLTMEMKEMCIRNDALYHEDPLEYGESLHGCEAGPHQNSGISKII
jgi:hypothetical protein